MVYCHVAVTHAPLPRMVEVTREGCTEAQRNAIRRRQRFSVKITQAVESQLGRFAGGGKEVECLHHDHYEQLQLSRWMIGGEKSATAGVSMAG